MTLLNTIVNLAGTWTGTLALWLVDSASFKDCEGVTDYRLDCDTLQELKVCVCMCVCVYVYVCAHVSVRVHPC